ncbi:MULTISPECIES: acyloxyacyl hydrolase [unclassified Yoonia]|uniref:acyloxyacyl hydrolase n=1 Tax=unclassified Yoonia TaxID=2629118 RepID=UPI002AFF4F8C|nr:MULTISPECIES: acyloxyacyl hydrolase [unclassified Yoonia]
MDGTFAVIFFIVGLTDTYLNECDKGCFALREAPARVALQLSETYFQSETISEELYATYDFARSYGAFQPVIGASATSDGDLWLGAGAKWTTQNVIEGPFFVELSFMPGLYVQGDGPDLGGPLEFRGALGVGYAFDNGATLTVLADHRSNADLGDINPGLETVGLRFAMPLN